MYLFSLVKKLNFFVIENRIVEEEKQKFNYTVEEEKEEENQSGTTKN